MKVVLDCGEPYVFSVDTKKLRAADSLLRPHKTPLNREYVSVLDSMWSYSSVRYNEWNGVLSKMCELDAENVMFCADNCWRYLSMICNSSGYKDTVVPLVQCFDATDFYDDELSVLTKACMFYCSFLLSVYVRNPQEGVNLECDRMTAFFLFWCMLRDTKFRGYAEYIPMPELNVLLGKFKSEDAFHYDITDCVVAMQSWLIRKAGLPLWYTEKKIVRCLRANPSTLCVSDIAYAINSSAKTVRNYLRTLEIRGLVVTYVEGKRINVKLADRGK